MTELFGELLATDISESSQDTREQHQHAQRRDDQCCQSLRSSVLTDVLAVELVFGDSVYRSGKGTDGVAKSGISYGDVFFVSRPAQFYPQGFSSEPSAQLPWQRGGVRPVEVIVFVIPRDGAVGKRDEKCLGASIGLPERDLLLYPDRVCRLR